MLTLNIYGKEVCNSNDNSLIFYVKKKYGKEMSETQMADFWLWLECIGEYGEVDMDKMNWSDKKCLEWYLKEKLGLS